MLSAREGLEHLASTLSEAEAEAVLALLDRMLPELFGRPSTYPVRRADGRCVRVTVPEN